MRSHATDSTQNRGHLIRTLDTAAYFYRKVRDESKSTVQMRTGLLRKYLGWVPAQS